MIELKEAIEKELLSVYKAFSEEDDACKRACLLSGAATLEWVLDRMKEFSNE